MSDSVVDESPVSDVEETVEPGNDLADWNYQEYVEYIPEEVKEKVLEFLTTEKRGWKTLARRLKVIASQSEYLTRLQVDFTDYCSKEHAKFGPKPQTSRDKLRSYFTAMDDEKLQNVCTKLSVSYASFMNSNDKAGLLEALCDEMESL